ncbi:MAG: outer membrane beta-barrel protein [Saprospiraceae bacterium]|nr:outer membrane beta-barrel protein [Saprospiraceae bacterium]
MKKTMISASLLFLAFGLFAQWSIAPTAGYSLSTSKINYDYFFDYKYAPRFFAGLQSQYSFSEKFMVGLGLQYTAKGFRTRGTAGGILEWKLDYLEAIPSFEYKPFDFMGIVLGPSIGYLMDVDYKEAGDKWTDPFGDTYKGMELGAMAGLKFYWQDLYLNLTFNRSLSNITNIKFTDENGNTIKNGKEFNQSFRLGLGYNFQLKEK